MKNKTNKKISSLMILSVFALLTACGPKTFKILDSQYEGLNGKLAKYSYTGLTISGIGKLNYLKSSSASDATHFANFVDGLLTHNDFGTLELNLAGSASHNDDYTEFTFKLRDDPNIYWSTFEGQPYTYNGEIQYVKASDFVAAAKLVNTFSFASDTGYLMRDFIKGAVEYYLYTQIMYGQANGTQEFMDMDTPKKQIRYIKDTIKNSYPAVYDAQYNPAYGGTELVESDINEIKTGARLGVKADDSKREVKYELLSSARYFPTLLTYSTYLPVNENFYNEKKGAFGSPSPDSILYCGPYILSKVTDTKIVYTRNEAYMLRKDLETDYYKIPRVQNIIYKIVPTNLSDDYARTRFEKGSIDGFSLSTKDVEGWKKYIKGKKGKGNGTIEEPYSKYVNSRWLDTIGDCYGSNIVMDRTKSSISKASYSTGGTAETVANTERALRIQEVRQAILASIDYETYYKRYYDEGDPENKVFGTQRLVSTYVPKEFVMDDNGNEYTQEYYAQALADYRTAHGQATTKEEAQALIAPGQYDTRHISNKAELDAVVDKAVNAINDYNSSALAGTYGQITFPIRLEYYTMWNEDQTTKPLEVKFINSMNRRLNKYAADAALPGNVSSLPYFAVVPTDLIDSDNYNKVSGHDSGSYAAFDFSVVQWGWGADYGDPQTYMNTYVPGGDWGSVFYYISQPKVDNIRYNSEHEFEVVNLLDEYTELVNYGKRETENLTARFTYFAQAEVLLINELGIYLPQVNNGQGWSLSISRSAGYEMPTANYGLSNDRLTGMWCLKTSLTGKQRKAIREQQEAAKAQWLATHDSYNIYGNDGENR